MFENNLVRSVSYTKSDIVVKNIDKYIKTAFSDLLLVFVNLSSTNFNILYINYIIQLWRIYEITNLHLNFTYFIK